MKKLNENFDFNKPYYKVIDETLKHEKLSFAKNGSPILNEIIKDILPFNEDKTKSCCGGGIYFTDEFNIFRFGGYGHYIGKITIPQDAKVILDPGGNKYRADKIIINSLTPIIEFKFDDVNWFDKLKEQSPTNEDLMYIIECSSFEYKEKASKLVFSQNPANRHLRYIIEYLTEEYKEKASELLLSQNPLPYDLRCIIRNSTDKYKEKAKIELDKI